MGENSRGAFLGTLLKERNPKPWPLILDHPPCIVNYKCNHGTVTEAASKGGVPQAASSCWRRASPRSFRSLGGYEGSSLPAGFRLGALDFGFGCRGFG